MPLYKQIDFNLGTPYEKFGAVPTITGSTFSMKEKGWSMESTNTKYIQYTGNFLPSNAYSVVAWVKNNKVASTNDRPLLAPQPNVDGRCISLGDNNYFYGGHKPTIAHSYPNNLVQFNYTNTDLNWHCFIFICPGNAQNSLASASFYVDGKSYPIFTSVTSVAQVRGTFNYVGGSVNAGSSVSISKIKIYDHVLTTKQILQEQIEFENAKPILSTKRYFQINKPLDLSYQKSRGLLAAYNMQSKGNILPDISGNRNNGTCSKVINTQDGLVFNGSDSVVSLTGSNGLSGDLTICARVFVKSGGVQNFGRIFSNLNTNLIISSNVVLLNRSNSSFMSSGSIAYSNWYNITVISTSTGVTNFYINGILSGTANQNTGAPIAGTAWYIGNNYTIARGVEGTIQDLRIYNRILGAQEIKQYHSSFAKLPYIVMDFSDCAVGETL